MPRGAVGDHGGGRGPQARYAPLEFLGLITPYDSPREDSKQIIADMQNYGDEVKMVTGENPAIAYDNTRVNAPPVRWNMTGMLTVSTVLGVTGSFLLFFILWEKGFSKEMIQSMMFLKLIVAGHSTL